MTEMQWIRNTVLGNTAPKSLEICLYSWHMLVITYEQESQVWNKDYPVGNFVWSFSPVKLKSTLSAFCMTKHGCRSRRKNALLLGRWKCLEVGINIREGGVQYRLHVIFSQHLLELLDTLVSAKDSGKGMRRPAKGYQFFPPPLISLSRGMLLWEKKRTDARKSKRKNSASIRDGRNPRKECRFVVSMQFTPPMVGVEICNIPRDAHVFGLENRHSLSRPCSEATLTPPFGWILSRVSALFGPPVLLHFSSGWYFGMLVCLVLLFRMLQGIASTRRPGMHHFPQSVIDRRECLTFADITPACSSMPHHNVGRYGGLPQSTKLHDQRPCTYSTNQASRLGQGYFWGQQKSRILPNKPVSTRKKIFFQGYPLFPV